jgi:hypothetical protein
LKAHLCRVTRAGTSFHIKTWGSTVHVRGTVVLVAADAASLLLVERLFAIVEPKPIFAPGAAGLFRKPPKAKNPGMKAGARDSRSVHPAATIIRDYHRLVNKI